MNQLQLKDYIQYDALMRQRIEEGKREILASQKKIHGIASEYNNKFKDEITRSTRERQLLLERPENQGKTEEEILVEHGKFMPSIHTPILNFLYYFVNEDYNNERELEREIQDKKYGALFEDINHSENVIAPKDMDQFVYGNCTHKTFLTIKKLKKMATSINNEAEAAAAYIACMKLCKKHNLEYDKIPS